MTEQDLSIVKRLPLSSIEIDPASPGVLGLLRERDSIETINAFPREYVLSIADDLLRVDKGEARSLLGYARRAGGKFYLAVPLRKTRQEALDFSVKAGGTLLSPASEDEDEAVNRYLSSTGFRGQEVHLGLVLNGEGRPVRWASGARLTQHHWSSPQDSLNAMQGRGVICHTVESGSQWTFLKNTERLYFVIEWR